MVEDCEDTLFFVGEILKRYRSEFRLLEATRLVEGQKLFREHRGRIRAIILDASVEPNSSRIDTLPLLEEIVSSGFPGSIVTCSGHPEYRSQMLERGCTHAYKKEDLSDFIKNALA